MIRRDVLQGERDQRVVKWTLVAAVVALSLGCFAELVVDTTVSEAAEQAAVQEHMQTPVVADRIAG